jgi:hypothetical protein
MATHEKILDSDLVRVREVAPNAKGRHPLAATLFWGDRVKVVGSSAKGPLVDLRIRREENGKIVRRTVRCFLPKQVKFRDTPLLKIRFVDVGQGDGCIVELPGGQLVLIDGGEESHLHRYMSTSFGHLLAKGPIDCRAIVVTHGDADHFAGLIDVVNAKVFHDSSRPFLTADAVYHNGLVKKTSSSLGRTTGTGKSKLAVELFDDLRETPDAKLSPTFKTSRRSSVSSSVMMGSSPTSPRRASSFRSWGPSSIRSPAVPFCAGFTMRDIPSTGIRWC